MHCIKTIMNNIHQLIVYFGLTFPDPSRMLANLLTNIGLEKNKIN